MAARLPPQPPVLGTGLDSLAQYLRRFSVWTMKELNARASTESAVPYVILTDNSVSPATVWKVTVQSGALHLTQMTPGVPP